MASTGKEWTSWSASSKKSFLIDCVVFSVGKFVNLLNLQLVLGFFREKVRGVDSEKPDLSSR